MSTHPLVEMEQPEAIYLLVRDSVRKPSHTRGYFDISKTMFRSPILEREFTYIEVHPLSQAVRSGYMTIRSFMDVAESRRQDDGGYYSADKVRAITDLIGKQGFNTVWELRDVEYEEGVPSVKHNVVVVSKEGIAVNVDFRLESQQAEQAHKRACLLREMQETNPQAGEEDIEELQKAVSLLNRYQSIPRDDDDDDEFKMITLTDRIAELANPPVIPGILVSLSSGDFIRRFGATDQGYVAIDSKRNFIRLLNLYAKTYEAIFSSLYYTEGETPTQHIHFLPNFPARINY